MKLFYKTISLVLFFVCVLSSFSLQARASSNDNEQMHKLYYAKEGYIEWVDFNADAKILKSVYELDVKFHNSDIDFDFCEALAYLSVKNANKFCYSSDKKNLDKLVSYVKDGGKITKIYPDNKYFDYYLSCYQAIFSGIVGQYTHKPSGEQKYGLRGYFPLAKGYWYTHYDDFGSSRSFGFKRRHLGHDIMGGIGTPIIAVEGGVVSSIGWNRYGGWRIGIRSHDTKRYYYYAHLRKDRPYAQDIKEGDEVLAGQVIGYLGNTGYSTKENVNLKTGKPHLHFGLQLIFDESQLTGNKEIWIDVYALSTFLSSSRAQTVKDPQTKEHISQETKI